MSRSLSATMMSGALSQESDICPIMLITITHDDLTEPIRISSDATSRIDESSPTDIVYGTVSNGETYIFLPMKLTLPTDDSDGPGHMTIEIDNIHQVLTESIRNIFTPASFDVAIVLSDSLNTVEAFWPEFKLTNIKYDELVISGTLALETLIYEPYPSGAFDPSRFPGLF